MDENGSNHPELTDLPSLACHAAIELEGFLLDQSTVFDAAEALSLRLADKEVVGCGPPRPVFLVDPPASLAMSQAILDSRLISAPMQSERELEKKADDILRRLKTVIGEAKRGVKNRDELILMRTFCLALSKSTSNMEESPYTESLIDSPGS
jgi:hypothetical protein